MDYGSNGVITPCESTASPNEGQTLTVDIMLIGEVAAHVGLEPKTIRFYERAKLLSPRRHGRIRIYRRHDVDNLLGIKKLRQYGVPISKIRSILHDEGSLSLATISSEPMQRLLELHLEDMRKKHIFILEQMEDLKNRLQQRRIPAPNSQQSVEASAFQKYDFDEPAQPREM